MHGRYSQIKSLFKLAQPKYRSILGIDISPAAVTILEISRNRESFCVERYGRESLPSHALEGNTIKDVNAIAACIRNLWIELKTNCKQVVIAVPDAAIISKVIQLRDGLHDEDIEELVAIEADKYIPYPIDEINLDFEILGHSEKNTSLLDVLLVASRTENVNTRVEALARAGLDVVVVDVESYAVARAAQWLALDLPKIEQNKTIAIIDVGAQCTHLFVLHDLRLIYSREEQFGGIQLIEAIAEHYKMTVEQAMVAKEKGQLPDAYSFTCLTSFHDNLLTQIKRTLQFFYSTNHVEDVDLILLAGDFARFPGLANLMQEKLGVSVTVANPFSHMFLGQMVHLDALNHDAPSLIVACGLALRNIQ